MDVLKIVIFEVLSLLFLLKLGNLINRCIFYYIFIYFLQRVIKIKFFKDYGVLFINVFFNVLVKCMFFRFFQIVFSQGLIELVEYKYVYFYIFILLIYRIFFFKIYKRSFGILFYFIVRNSCV